VIKLYYKKYKEENSQALVDLHNYVIFPSVVTDRIIGIKPKRDFMKIFCQKKSVRSFLFSICLIISLSLTNNTYTKALKATKSYGDALVEQVIKVHDGDTIKVDIKNYPDIIGNNVSIRLYGIDTPSIRTKNTAIKALGLQAKAFVEEWIDQVLSQNKIIELKNLKRGKYFRIIADVEVEGKSLAQDLLDAGLAVPYFGGKKPNWAHLLRTKAIKRTPSLAKNISSNKNTHITVTEQTA